MKTLPAGLQMHLDTGYTTLAWCWRLTRADTTTDHDQDITTFQAATGFTASEIRASVG